MDYPELIKHYTSDSMAAEAIRTDRQRVFNWRKTGKIPLDAQIDFEIDTEGKLKADIPRCIRDGSYTAEKKRRAKAAA